MIQALLPLLRLPALSHQIHTLPVHELDRIHVQVPRSRIRPFAKVNGFTRDPHTPTGRAALSFNFWQLFHATKKAELLEYRAPAAVFLSALGSLIEHFDLFATCGELRLQSGKSELYGDFSSTGLAGRLAQGLAFLFMESRGYAYGERLDSLLNRILRARGHRVDWGLRREVLNSPLRAQPSRSPDFIFQRNNPAQEVAIAESKGSFVNPGAQPPIKTVLSEGLDQLNGWNRFLVPMPQKSFVVGSFLREEGDVHHEPSMLAFVDPQGDQQMRGERSYPDDAIRRANYAAWLRQMSFPQSATALALARPSQETSEYILPVIQLPSGEGTRRFAFRIWASLTDFAPSVPATLDLDLVKGWNHWVPFPFLGDPAVFLISALETTVLDRVSQAVREPSRVALSDLPSITDVSVPADGPLAGSVFADGTFIGAVSAGWLAEQKLERENFTL
jgi:hypothetical protein